MNIDLTGIQVDPVVLIALAAIVTGVVSALRQAVKLDAQSRFLPAISIGLGMVITAVVVAIQPPPDTPVVSQLGTALLTGLIVGLQASGLYSGGKATIKG